MTKLEELKAAYAAARAAAYVAEAAHVAARNAAWDSADATADAARGAYYTAAAAADAAAYDAWGAYRDELMKTQEENADD